ncbi:MAG: hypothetical protein AAFY38_02425 [Pseudomonadota bacterium]
MEAEYEKQKESSGGLAAIVWLGTCAYLLFFTDNGGALLSLGGIGFAVVGMFIAALGIGLLFYLIQRGIGKVLLGLSRTPNAAIATVAAVVGLALTVGQFAVTVSATVASFNYFFGV